MLTNAIAEMRTYGEGFIIADQSPGLLDPAVIRNTNTKIVLRLPDQEDRVLVGKAENLSESQICELARLPTGCAAIYQNNWQEAVLCQIGQRNSSSARYAIDESQGIDDVKSGRMQAECLLLASILRKLRARRGITKGYEPLTGDEQDVLRQYYPWLQDNLLGNVAEKTLLRMFDEHFVHESLEAMPRLEDCTQWVTKLMGRVMTRESIEGLSEVEKDEVARATMQLLSGYAEDPGQKQFFIDQCANAHAWRIS